MDSLAKFLQGLSGFAWPATVLFLGFLFRNQIRSFMQLIRQQLASGAALKWKDFEFKGVGLWSFDTRDGSGYRQEPADRTLFDKRHATYAANRNLFLVHRIRSTGTSHEITQLPTYDVSVYLISHKNFGHLNDVRQVEYYLGQHFGLKISEFGTKYVVQNGTDGFAVRVNAYGPMLCQARVIFHAGTETTVSRYLDFEGTGYVFQPETNVVDIEKIKNRREA